LIHDLPKHGLVAGPFGRAVRRVSGRPSIVEVGGYHAQIHFMETRLVDPAHTGDSLYAMARPYCALLTEAAGPKFIRVP